MLKKNYSKTGNICRVTFRLPAEVDSDAAFLYGDFNQWDGESTPMKKLKDGSFSVTVSLQAGRSYRFRYRLDNDRWENDWEADDYLPNQLGTDDSIVTV